MDVQKKSIQSLEIFREMNVLGSLVGAGCLISIVFYFWDEISLSLHSFTREEFVKWTFKGFVLPSLLWILFACGWIPGIGALHQDVRLARWAGLNPWTIFVEIGAKSLLLICSFWAATTLAWMVTISGFLSDKKNDFYMLSIFWSVLMLPLSGGIVWLFGYQGTGVAVAAWMVPMLHYTITLMPCRRKQPLYSRAIAKMKFGKDKEAEMEVIRELEKCEDDYNGWMMLAELYATRFHDVQEADRTIRGLCNQQNVNGVQISIALNKLADWHLRYGQDPRSARSAVELIIQKLPGTHFAKMAEMRLSRMPASVNDLIAQQQPRCIALQKVKDFSSTNTATRNRLSNDGCSRANWYVELLTKDPNDISAREELALVFAEELGKVSEGIEQLQLLLEMPTPPEAKRPEWMSLMAEWYLRHLNDLESGRKMLQKVIQEHSGTSYAFAAQQRLNLIEMEHKFRRVSGAV